MEVVINKRFGGFRLSEKALDKLADEHDFTKTKYDDGNYADEDAEIIDSRGQDRFGHYCLKNSRDKEVRTNPAVIQVVKELGSEAGDRHSELKIVEIPDGTDFTIESYDGKEYIAEKHNTWV